MWKFLKHCPWQVLDGCRHSRIRLPKKVLNAEIKVIEDLGVKIHLNTKIGKDISFDKLKSDYSAIFIGCGTMKSSKLNIPARI